MVGNIIGDFEGIRILRCPVCGKLPKTKIVEKDLGFGGYTATAYCKPLFSKPHISASVFNSYERMALSKAYVGWNLKCGEYKNGTNSN